MTETAQTAPMEPTGDLVGSTVARLHTRPLAPSAGWAEPRGRVCTCGCGLSESTSKGWACIDFAATVGVTLLPWQWWLLIHGLELLEDGRYRFRRLLVLVARQNGKTTLLKVLALWRMWQDGGRMVLGTSTKLEYAKESWRGTIELGDDYDAANGWPSRNPRHGRPKDVNFHFERTEAEPAPAATDDAIPGLEVRHLVAPSTGRRRQVGRVPCMVRNVREGVSDMEAILTNGARYKIATANRDGGRSLSVDLGIVDELREHQSYAAWAAIGGTITARSHAQIWALSNAGDNTSVVLNDLRGRGLGAIADPTHDDRFGLFEWSAADLDCDLMDRAAWVQANPALGYTITGDDMAENMKQPPAVARTEHLCQHVPSGNPAIDRGGWVACADPTGTMATLRGRVALCIDSAPDGRHITLVAAAPLEDGRVRVETVAAWSSAGDMRRDRPGAPSLATWVTRIRPRAMGWFPQGPAAAIKPDLAEWTKIGAESVPAVCQGLAELVESRRLLHSDDPVLTAQVLAATRTPAADGGWRFIRKGEVGHVDAAYAAAGAVYLTRTVPAPRPRRGLIIAST